MSRTGGLKVKVFDADQGFGFIVPDKGGADVSLRISAMEKRTVLSKLSDKSKFTFETPSDESGRRGKTAGGHVDGLAASLSVAARDQETKLLDAFLINTSTDCIYGGCTVQFPATEAGIRR